MTRIILVIFALAFAVTIYNLPTFDEAVESARVRAEARELAK